MAKPLTLSNGRTFKSQKSAEDHFRSIRDSYEEGNHIDDSAHHADLLSLLERYDALILDGPAKSSGGVAHFFWRMNVNPEGGPRWASRGFWLTRKDGTTTDFSFLDAVRGQPHKGARELYDACRNAVAVHLDECKDRHFARYANPEGQLACEFSGTLVTRKDAHLDHAAPFFVDIVKAFRAEHGWDDGPPAGVLIPPADEQTTTVFADPAFASAFIRFHGERARIRIIDQANAPRLSDRKLRAEVQLLVDLD